MAVVDDALTQLLRYESGSVDWIAAVPTEVAAEMKQKGRSDLKSFSAFGTTYLTFMIRPKLNNGASNPLSDIRVRTALGMAIDKQQIVETITRMGEKTATVFVPPDVFDDYHSPKGIAYDRAEAKRLMEEAGYGKGGRIPNLSYIYRSDLPSSRELAQTLARQWKQVLNIDIPLESAERKHIRQRLNERDYTISSADWYGDYGDPSTFTDKYRSNSENNDCEWKNPKYDALVLAATKEGDVAKRLRLLEQAEQILLNDAPIFPLYHPTNQYLFHDNVKGINLHPRNMTMFKGVEVIRDRPASATPVAEKKPT
jgi:oligopeptide transport system substrate-binding protein